MSPDFWRLLGGGVVVGLRRRDAAVIATIQTPQLRPSLGEDALDLVLRGVREVAYHPRSDRWDEPFIDDLVAIAAVRPEIGNMRMEAGALRIDGPSGTLWLDYEAHTLELAGAVIEEGFVRAAITSHWAAWRAEHGPAFAHPLVREAMLGTWSAQQLPRLIAAWRVERTSELADIIELLSVVLEHEPRALDSLESFAGWPAHYHRAATPSLAALVDAAFGTFDLLAEQDPGSGPALGAWLDARTELRARWWRALADAVGTLRDGAPDPRIGRTVIAMLRSPSDHWFRIDQVAHVAGPFEAPDDAPSFADHALALIEHHADGGTAARLEERARLVGIECDCNGAEMRDALRELAGVVRARYPSDRTLPNDARRALVHRLIDG